jgi:hypothetical protein
VNSQPVPNDPWISATFDGNEREQLRHLAKLPLEKKIERLERPYKVSRALQESRLVTGGPKTVRGNGNREDLR